MILRRCNTCAHAKPTGPWARWQGLFDHATVGSSRHGPADIASNERLNPISPEVSARRSLPPEKVKILQGCRDMVVHGLLTAFASMLDKIGDMLIERGGRSDVREEQQLYLDARVALTRDRTKLMVEFEKRLRNLFDGRIRGTDNKPDFSEADASDLALVDHLSMDESVITSNIVRVVENSA